MKKKVYTATDVLDARRIVKELEKRGIEGFTKDGGPDDCIELNGISVYGKGIYVEAEDVDEAREALKEIEGAEKFAAQAAKDVKGSSDTKKTRNGSGNEDIGSGPKSDTGRSGAGAGSRSNKPGKSNSDYDGEYEGGGGAGKVIAVVLITLIIAAVVIAVFMLKK